MKRVIILTAIMLCLGVSQAASAHVLVTDNSGKTGAVLHIIADDDPIAGEESSLYFDVQNTVVAEGIENVSASIKTKDREDKIAMKIDGSLATAKYVFPLQDQYGMTFTVETKAKTYTYEQVQRVTRGMKKGALDQPTYAWAEVLLIGSGTLLLVGGVLLWNHRKELWRQSTF